MKKRFTSLEELKRNALAKGASVDFKGQQFNTTHEQVIIKRPKPEPLKPAPIVKPEPVAPVQVDMTPIAHAMQANNQHLTKAIADALRQAPTPNAPTGWTMKVHRNQWGHIETITATPTL